MLQPLPLQSPSPSRDPAPTISAIRRWSTDSVAPEDRLDYWVGAICEGFLEMDASSTLHRAFEGHLESAPLAGIGVNRVRTRAQQVVRSRRAIARSRENFYYLLRDADSRWSATQDGRSAHLLPGDLVLVDSRRCYGFSFLASTRTVSLELPIAWVERWLPRPEQLVAQRIDGQTGWGHVLSELVQQWTPELASRPPLPGALLADQLGATLALATGSSPAQEGQDDSALTRLRSRSELAIGIGAAIEARHAEAGLTAPDIARQLGISERSLHRCLSEQGRSFGGLLAASRMASAQRLLTDRRFDRLSVAEVGRRVGLADASHFIRQCRRHLGGTPGTLRARR